MILPKIKPHYLKGMSDRLIVYETATSPKNFSRFDIKASSLFQVILTLGFGYTEAGR